MENEQNRKIAIEIAKYPELAFKYSSEKRFNKYHWNMGNPNRTLTTVIIKIELANSLFGKKIKLF